MPTTLDLGLPLEQYNQAVGDLLREAREELGLAEAKVARRRKLAEGPGIPSITQTDIKAYERGEPVPLASLARLASVYRKPVQHFVPELPLLASRLPWDSDDLPVLVQEVLDVIQSIPSPLERLRQLELRDPRTDVPLNELETGLSYAVLNRKEEAAFRRDPAVHTLLAPYEAAHRVFAAEEKRIRAENPGADVRAKLAPARQAMREATAGKIKPRHVYKMLGCSRNLLVVIREAAPSPDNLVPVGDAEEKAIREHSLARELDLFYHERIVPLREQLIREIVPAVHWRNTELCDYLRWPRKDPRVSRALNYK